MSMTLVLAGGGPAALARELGVLRGLADADAGLAPSGPALRLTSRRHPPLAPNQPDREPPLLVPRS